MEGGMEYTSLGCWAIGHSSVCARVYVAAT